MASSAACSMSASQDADSEDIQFSSEEDSDSGDSLCEEVIIEEGEREMVLVSCKKTCQPEKAVVPEPSPASAESIALFCTTTTLLEKEELIKRSPRGHKVGMLLHVIAGLEKKEIAEISSTLMQHLTKCMQAGSRHKLLSSVQAAIWSAFHRLRCSQDVHAAWAKFISRSISTQHQQESHLCLQLVMDRMLKQLIHNKAEENKHNNSAVVARLPHLSVFQSNGIRYMAGYIAIKLIKKFSKRSKHPKLQLKRKMFIQVLNNMKATSQPGMPNSPLEYFEVWADLIDRGGLYHINTNVFDLIELIERITRQHINTSCITTYTPGHDLRQAIKDEVLSSFPVLCTWDEIAHTIPVKYQQYSIELLGVITDLWISIRGHSFAKETTMKFERKYKKSTRKELKKKDKEAKEEQGKKKPTTKEGEEKLPLKEDQKKEE